MVGEGMDGSGMGGSSGGRDRWSALGILGRVSQPSSDSLLGERKERIGFKNDLAPVVETKSIPPQGRWGRLWMGQAWGRR